MVVKKYMYSVFLSLLSSIGLIKTEQSKLTSFQQKYSIGSIKENRIINAEIASAPGVNCCIPFPYGQKSIELMLSSVAQDFAPFAVVSQKSPIDSENISRISLPSGTLSSLFSSAINDLALYIPSLQGRKNLKVIPKLLITKDKFMGITVPTGIVGIELCFPPAEQAFLGKISRIAFIFVQNITKENTDQILQSRGFNSIAINDTQQKKMFLINSTEEQRKYSRELIRSLITDLKNNNSKLLSPIFNKLDSVLSSLSNTTVGIIIESNDNFVKELNSFDKQYGLGHVFLSDDHYLFWKTSNKGADAIAHLIQKHKMPLASNYYLFGRVMGYSEDDIKLRYQIEGYLRSTDQLNGDGTVAWPYNICKWGIEKGMKFNDWVKNKWNAKLYLLTSDKMQRKQYEKDKKDAQKYIALLPMSKEEAEKKVTEPEKPQAVKKERPVPITPPSLSDQERQKEYTALEDAGEKFLTTKYTDDSFELFAKAVTQLKDPSFKIMALKYILNPAMTVDVTVKPGIRKTTKISLENTINTMYKESNFSQEDINEYTLTFGNKSKIKKYEKIIKECGNLKKQQSADAKIKQQVVELEDKFIQMLLADFFKVGLEKIRDKFNLIQE